jgi:hypothetical protein
MQQSRKNLRVEQRGTNAMGVSWRRCPSSYVKRQGQNGESS